MTDCDLCGRAIPTVNPVRVLRPLLKFAYPEGVWKGLCETCLESAEETRVKVAKETSAGKKGKCALCGDKTDLYAVEMHIPDFSKEVVKKNAMLCEKCLKAAGETYVKFKREQHGEHGHGHGHH
ncbi:dehydrogenase [Methanosarcina sp. KYL-1]|uniref:F420H2 dehydrogenase subunit FpoO n=1 Tax=Methanosarcina sp. KYL-1 TaxID=2602068 RepID=UPI002100BC84|nr:F420H2 dehydrogenase subunit FpoO [Methanosarcina sp. KYL-1]MCQ1537034.1 dehydrogenase [Methanosarcina sp. KYL-1]